MLRYKTETRPGLVALYNTRPGNGAGQFLQPRSWHGATASKYQSQYHWAQRTNTPSVNTKPNFKVLLMLLQLHSVSA